MVRRQLRPRAPPMSDPAALHHCAQLLSAGRHAQARAVLARILARMPGDPDANSLMGIACAAAGEHTQSLYYADRALRAAPGDPGFLINRGHALIALRRPDEALDAYRAAAAANPADPDARIAITYALYAARRFREAEDEARAALALFPHHPRLVGNLAVALFHTARAREAVALLRDACEKHPHDLTLVTALAQFANYAGGISAEEVLQLHLRFAAVQRRAATPPPGWSPHPPAILRPPPEPRDPQRPLRIAFLSGDLRSHACAFFLRPIVEHLDRARFFVAAYMTLPLEDAESARLRAYCDLWRNVAPLSDAALAEQVRRDSIDIVIEASGLTSGHRLGALALRPAPVAMTYFGYPNTTGLAEIDFRIVDSITDPHDGDGLASERLLRLDPCFLCYRPMDGAPPEGPPPVAAPGASGVTFGSCNAIAKIDEGATAVWAAILASCPGSRLLLRHHGLFEDRSREHLRDRFARAGLADAGARLLLEPPGEGAAAVLPTYQRIDIALDTFPYTGTTTTCEALFMGVPVITLEGDRCAARVSASILRALDLGDLVARNAGAYIDAALRLASDRPRLASLRSSLRGRLLASAVGDQRAFADRFGDLLRRAWSLRAPQIDADHPPPV